MSNYNYDQEMHSQSMIQDDINYKQMTNALAYQKDVEYMKQLFPSVLQIIQTEIDDECDKLEYSGSVMFDEYPDKTHLRMIVDRIMMRLSTSDEDENDGDVQGASLDYCDTSPRYCEDDAMLDCEEEYSVEATGFEQNPADGLSKEFPRRWGPGWGPGWGSGKGPGWGPGWGPPPRPWGPRQCFGPHCPIVNRPCGHGRWCPPTPFADYDDNGNPNWMRHLVENMLTNEMTYRRSRYRNHNL